MQKWKVTYIEQKTHKTKRIEVEAECYNDAFLTAWDTIGDYAGPATGTEGIISIKKLKNR